MMETKRSDIAWLIDESKALAKCAAQTWTMVPPWHRFALGGASALMAINPLANIYQALLLGQLVDRVHDGLGNTSRETLIRQSLSICNIF